MSFRTVRRPAIRIAMLGCAIATLAGCGGPSAPSKPAPSKPAPSGSTAPGARGAMITIKNFRFEPAALTVAPGTKVTVANNDSAPHTVTATGKQFDTGTILGGRTATFTAPTTPGSYAYICDIHKYMHGTLVVK